MSFTVEYIGDLKMNISIPLLKELTIKEEDKPVRLEYLITWSHQEKRHFFCKKRKILAKQMAEANSFRYGNAD